MYKCVNIHIYYSNRVNIYVYYSCKSCFILFFSLPSLEPSLWLFLFLSSQRLTLSFSLNFPLSKFPWPILSHCCSPLAIATVVFLHSSLQSLFDLTHFCSILLSLFALHWVKSQLNPTTTTTVVYGNGYWRSSISLNLIYGFENLYSIRLICGFEDLDLAVKIWCCLHVIGLDFDFKCIWVLWIGNLNGFGGFGLRFP